MGYTDRMNLALRQAELQVELQLPVLWLLFPPERFQTLGPRVGMGVDVDAGVVVYPSSAVADADDKSLPEVLVTPPAE